MNAVKPDDPSIPQDGTQIVLKKEKSNNCGKRIEIFKLYIFFFNFIIILNSIIEYSLLNWYKP